AGIFRLTGYIQRRQGRWEESTRNLERAVDLDPRNLIGVQELAFSYGMLRRYADKTSVLARAWVIDPSDVTTKAPLASVNFDWKADPRPLHKMIDSVRATNPSAMSHIAE